MGVFYFKSSSVIFSWLTYLPDMNNRLVILSRSPGYRSELKLDRLELLKNESLNTWQNNRQVCSKLYRMPLREKYCTTS